MRHDRDDEALLTRAAWLYYVQDLVQEEIARRLGCSRTKVVRLLARARERGLVRIELKSPFGACFELESRLKERFGLRDAVVVPTGRDESINKTGIAKAAALFLERSFRDRDIVGAGWGTTVYEVGQQLGPVKSSDLTLVQLMGGINAATGPLNPLEVVKLLATRIGARGLWLNTPLVVDSPEIKEALLSDEGVRRVLEMAKSVNIALVGIGSVGPGCSLAACQVLRAETVVQLMGRGAVGDILGQFFDRQGRPVRSGVEERMMAFPIGGLSAIPVVVGVAGGTAKIEAVLGALRGGFVNVLVTDEATAQAALAMAAG
ncbi:MAG: sugar-binding transcriptional regulator [Patescibacteria group bacterium]